MSSRPRKRRRRWEWRSFVEAREYARSLGMGSQAEWRKWSRDSGKRPADVPGRPDLVYKSKGWKGYGDWLGTGNVMNLKKTYRSFESCRAFARGLGLRSSTEWHTWSRDSGKRPADVPSHPDRMYKGKGWKGYGDWLGTGNVRAGYRRRKRKRAAEAEQDDHDKEQEEEEEEEEEDEDKDEDEDEDEQEQGEQEQEQQQQASPWQGEAIEIVTEHEFWEAINGTYH